MRLKIDTFLTEEKYLALPATDFGEFDQAVDDFSIFNELWNTVAQYQSL